MRGMQLVARCSSAVGQRQAAASWLWVWSASVTADSSVMSFTAPPAGSAAASVRSTSSTESAAVRRRCSPAWVSVSCERRAARGRSTDPGLHVLLTAAKGPRVLSAARGAFARSASSTVRSGGSTGLSRLLCAAIAAHPGGARTGRSLAAGRLDGASVSALPPRVGSPPFPRPVAKRDSRRRSSAGAARVRADRARTDIAVALPAW